MYCMYFMYFVYCMYCNTMTTKNCFEMLQRRQIYRAEKHALCGESLLAVSYSIIDGSREQATDRTSTYRADPSISIDTVGMQSSLETTADRSRDEATAEEQIMVFDFQETELSSSCLVGAFRIPAIVTCNSTLLDEQQHHQQHHSLQFVVSSRYAVKYDFLHGLYSCYDRRDNRLISKIFRPLPSGDSISVSCVSPIIDGMFFFAYHNEPSVFALLIGSKDSSREQLSAVGSSPIAADNRSFGHSDKFPIPLGNIVSLHCHPTELLLFAVYAKGQVLVRGGL